MFLNFFQVLICTLIFTGCSGGTKALKSAYRSECKTTVEATFYSYGEWVGDYPAIVVKEGDRERTYVGKLLAVEDEGIRFDPKRRGLFRNKPERLYTYEEVLFAIDEDYKIVRGSPPSALSMTFELTPEKIGEPVELTLRSGLETSVCVRPGRYFLTKIQFWNSYKYREKSISLPQMILDIQPGKINSLGQIYLDETSMEDDDLILDISYKVIANRKRGGNTSPVHFANGRRFVGYGVASRMGSNNRNGEHTLSIKYGQTNVLSNKHYAWLQFIQ